MAAARPGGTGATVDRRLPHLRGSSYRGHHPVTNSAFRAFTEATGHRPPHRRADWFDPHYYARSP